MLDTITEEKEWDIIIIGGGATGIGAALDAATRSYKTLLIEQSDFAKGTSSRSTKLVHGGVRYLAQGNIKLVREALFERGRLLKNAPHITSAMGFVVPVYNWSSKFYYGAGLKVYDVLSGKLSLGKTLLLNKQETIERLPGIDTAKLSGGILYYDGRFDDARLAIDMAVTAAAQGALMVNYCKALSLIKENKKVKGIVVKELIGGKEYEVKGKVIINATGVFANYLMQDDEPNMKNIVTPSQGIHLVVDKKFFPGSNAMMIPKTDDGRVLFAVPWHNKVVIGTTDTQVDTISENPKPLREEIDFVLHHANRYLAADISETDVTSMFAGLRPLVKKGTGKTSLLSRDHTIIVSPSGLVTITGGKWTTYRKMAEDVINNAAFVAKLPKKDCITKNFAIQSPPMFYRNENLQQGFSDYSKEMIAWFINHEMAMTAEDILARRTRLLFLDAKQAIEKAAQVIADMAAIMNKNEDWQQQQLKQFIIVAKQYLIEG